MEPQTDFIFAVTGEELGFIGCAAVIILLALIVLECLWIGSKARDYEGMLDMLRFWGINRISDFCKSVWLRG